MDKVEKLKKDVGIRARRIRERLGFKSRERFAEILDVHSNTVGQLERGTIWLSPEMATLYYEKFGINPAEFLTEKPIVIQPTPEEALEIIAKAIKKGPLVLPVVDSLAGLNEENRAVIKKHIAAAKARQLLDSVKGNEDEA